MDLLKQAKSIKKQGIWGFCLIFTLIGIFATMILAIISGIKIMSTDWKDSELNSSKTIWGLMCFIFLGPIAAWVFGAQAVNKLSGQANTNK